MANAQWARLQREYALKIKREFLVCMGTKRMQQISDVGSDNLVLLYCQLRK